MDIVLVLSQMGILFFMMLAGFIANKAGIMGKESETWLSRLVVNVTCPALIIVSVTTCERLEDNKILAEIFLVAVGYYVILPILSKAVIRLIKIKKDQASEYEAMLVYSNIGFMGLPIVNAVLGQKAILYLTVFMAVFNISIFSYGLLLLAGGEQTLNWRKLINPGTVSALAAVVLYLLNAGLPPVLGDSVAAIGNITTPLAMLVIGSSLANQPIRDVLEDKSAIIFVCISLIVFPLLFLGVGRIFIDDHLLLGVIVLSTGMPVAANVAMIRNESGGDGAFISKGIFLSNLFSIASIPIIAMLLPNG